MRKRDAIRRLQRAERELERAQEEFLLSHGWKPDEHDSDVWLDPQEPHPEAARCDPDTAVWRQRLRMPFRELKGRTRPNRTRRK